MMRIVITQRTDNLTSYDDPRDGLSRDWGQYLNRLFPDALLFPIPNTVQDVNSWLETIGPDCVIFSNGEGVGANSARDELERALYSWATKQDIPLLGVCRGMQQINHLHGGNLTKDIEGATGQRHVGEHSTKIIHPLFARELGLSELGVNSFHNEGFTDDQLSSDLTVFAVSGACVEGVFRTGHRVMGIQWHPERNLKDTVVVDRLVYKFLKKELDF